MNTVALSGRLAQNAVVFGREHETLKFTLACQSGYEAKTNAPRTEFVPCVLFRAPEKLRSLLIAQGKGKPVEVRGRIVTSSFEKDGVMRYATEVVVDPREFHLLRLGGAQDQSLFHTTAEPQRYSPDPKGGEAAYGQQTTRRDLPGFGVLGD